MDEKLQLRTVSLLEINSCPYKRLDPEHYLPIHRIWECKHQNKLRTKQAIINAWLEGKISSKQFLLAYQVTQQQQQIPKKNKTEAV